MVSPLNPALQNFTANCDAVFSPVLAPYGFVRVAHVTKPQFCYHIYRNDKRYVEVMASADPRDYPDPAYCQLTLGEGEHEPPETDWNKIDLGSLRPGRSRPRGYSLADVALEQALRQMCANLLRNATDFLTNDLRRFHTLRAEQVSARKPYTIHEPDGSGGYISRVDPVSAALKERFSKE